MVLITHFASLNIFLDVIFQEKFILNPPYYLSAFKTVFKVNVYSLIGRLLIYTVQLDIARQSVRCVKRCHYSLKNF